MRTDVEVFCGVARPTARASERRMYLNLSGKNKNISLMHDISKGLATNIPPVLADLLEIATYVNCADHATARGGDGVLDYGRRWRRSFRFHVGVREPSLWSSPSVLSVLERTLNFLSDDDYSFSFTGALHATPVQRYFASGQRESICPEYDKVMLFSGGLDSLAGAVELLVKERVPTLLVSHRSSRKLDPRVRDLVHLLGTRCDSTPLFHLPVRIEKKGLRSSEYTQRTRSFLYAALAATTANAIGLGGIHFFENGIVSLNLPFASQVVGARATRTTHPEALNGFAELFSALLGRPFAVANPFLWKTKADIVGLIMANGCADLIPFSNSCTRTFEMTRLHTHCGVCSQCLDRRIAVLAAGADSYDPEEMYRVKLMTDPRPPGEARTMAECFVRAANEMSSMTEREFLGRFGEVSRIARALAGNADDNARCVYDLHAKHARCVTEVVDRAISRHATELRQGRLPESCLIMLSLPGTCREGEGQSPRTTRRRQQSPSEPSDEVSCRSRATQLGAILQSIKPGNDSASAYHNSILDAVKVLFFPRLSLPKKEQEVNEGRKRIDIVCRNTTKDSFFSDLRSVYNIHCPFIMFECKNYSEDPENPEFDQLSGRFGAEESGRGRFGILVCRAVEHKERIKMQCRDRFRDRREYILVLADEHVLELLKLRSEGRLSEMDELLHSLFSEIFF